MLPDLSEDQKRHLSRCIYEEPTLKKAGSRAAAQDPQLALMNVTGEELLWVYSRSVEHLDFLKEIRSELEKSISDHSYIPPLDRVQCLGSNADELLKRIHSLKKTDDSMFVRLSTELRHVFAALREEAKIILGDGVDDRKDPILAALQKLQAGSLLEEKLKELGVVSNTVQ